MASVVQRRLAEIQVVGKKMFSGIECAADTYSYSQLSHAAEGDLKP